MKNISFEVEKGEIVGFLGSNAAGKTTTMRILTCYLPPTQGKAQVAGYDVLTQSLEVRKNVGYLPENVPLYTDMSVEYFLDFVVSLKGLRGKALTDGVESAIDRCGLDNVREFLIGNLSKGYRQRVGIAQAIINDPPVLILDEPTVGLDPKQIIDIRSLIRSFGGKSTVILSTHILHEIEQVCNRILIIDRGELLAFDTRENLADRLFDSTRLKVTVEGPADRIKSLLKGMEGVKKVRDAGKVDKEVYTFKMLAPRDYKARREIASRIVSAGYRLVDISPGEVSVEEIFRKIVPDKIPSDTPVEDEAGGKSKTDSQQEAREEVVEKVTEEKA